MIPMAASLAFGIVFATVITLFLIPALYMILDDFKDWWKEAWTHLTPARFKGEKPAELGTGAGLVQRPKDI